jgi:transcriptional adapter 2-alpha
MIQTGGKFTQYHCSYCHVDITQQIRIKCAECADFDLCADCFCSGVELLPHKPSHSYRVVDSTHFPIFSKDWTLGEELLLLEGDYLIL